MSAVRCEDCNAVWLSAPAQELIMTTSGGGGCLRCDGTLHPMTDAEVEEHLSTLAADPPRGRS